MHSELCTPYSAFLLGVLKRGEHVSNLNDKNIKCTNEQTKTVYPTQLVVTKDLRFISDQIPDSKK
ncbi:predicted protein [Sclerotinia sclerotiorum 1980 UF-70]|uniref:Uncharacterized protein n=1 Tax=Sclerotinia sclerotiorum (strain ATCC 18683 / 1980 / Ss-1) TaxID=665079 RepID=A7EFC3_SCLS1|nr:predicted protein [Sclerotinia sclerotiorum 1980 UF-70]EDO01539.1 predicted protein [Sclerotinia sclerotiorum 1980 UF-70]